MLMVCCLLSVGSLSAVGFLFVCCLLVVVVCLCC